MIEQTRARLKSATGVEIGKIVASLGLACRHARDQDEEGKAAKAHRLAAAELMVRYLIGYPLDILAAAADQWIKTKVFFPAIAEIRALCEPEFQRRRAAVELMQRAIKASDEKARQAERATAIRAERADPARRAAVGALLAKAQRDLTRETAPVKRKVRQVELTDEQREAALANVRAGKIGR